MAPASANADVRATDRIVQDTVSDLGLDESACPDVQAENAILVSSDGVVYFWRDADEPVKIASITKIMSVIVALENCDLNTTVTVPAEAIVDGSNAGLWEGDTLTLENLLPCMLVPSGNDAAITCAYAVGTLLPGYDGTFQGAYDAFVACMNETALRLGCTDTLFTNPCGLDEDEFESEAHSTAADVAIIIAYAMQNPLFRDIVAGGSCSVQVVDFYGNERTLDLQTTDLLLGEYEGACGGKTGTTELAGYCYAGAAQIEGIEYYVVVLNSPDPDQRFIDSEAIYDWVGDSINDVELIHCPSLIAYDGQDVPIVASVSHADWADRTVAATVPGGSVSGGVFALYGEVTQEVSYETLSGSVHTGDVVGSISFSQNGSVISTSDLIAAEDLSSPDFWNRIDVKWKRYWRQVQGLSPTAQSQCYNDLDQVNDR